MNEKYQRKKLLSAEDKAVLNKYCLRWVSSVFLVGLLVSFFSLKVNDYYLVTILGKITPGIDKWTAASNHPDIAKVVWVYMTYTAPFVILRVLYHIKRINITYPVFTILFFSFLTYFSTSAFITGTLFGLEITVEPPSGGPTWYVFYKRYETGTIIFALIWGGFFVCMWIVLLLIFIELFNLRRFMEK